MSESADRSGVRPEQPAAVPWQIWCSVIAVTSAIVGVHWDISWHRSIGRDSFWTPAHIAIYLCGVLAGLASGSLILSTTLGRNEAARQASVRIWGFRGPLGAFLSAWGGIAMLTSAPFDNWWHGAYGLDVKILSPPHMVLAAGMVTVGLGALILILGPMNRSGGGLHRRLHSLFLYTGAAIVVFMLVVTMEYLFRIYMHSATFYRVVCLTAPPVLAAVAMASGRRWAATSVIGIYTVFLLGMQWIFPLFPAEPKLGPVYQKVTHFIPPEFPLLLIVPAVALDLLRSRAGRWNRWLQAATAGPLFLATFLAVQWPFASFLMSPAARNWFFGTHYLDYGIPSTSYYVRNLFFPLERTPAEFWTGMAIALVAAVLSTRLGLAWGSWMQRIRR